MIFDKESENYIKEVIQDSQKAPNNGRYHHVIKPPIVKKYLPPVFILLPLQNSNIGLVYSYYSEMLSSGMWTDDLLTPVSVKNPQLGYNFFSNFLLTQRYYNCIQENHPNHRFLSSDVRILTQLPENALNNFQLVKYYRCLLSCQLIDYVFRQISRHVFFYKYPKAIAQLDVSEYCRLGAVYQGSEAYQNVSQNSMFVFPSSDKIKDIFLDVYPVRIEQY